MISVKNRRGGKALFYQKNRPTAKIYKIYVKTVLSIRKNTGEFSLPAAPFFIPAESAKFREKNPVIPAKRTPSFPQKEPRHSRESGNPLRAINFGIPAHFSRKLSLEFPHIFFCKKRCECGDLSVKMDSRFRGNDGGEGGNSAARN